MGTIQNLLRRHPLSCIWLIALLTSAMLIAAVTVADRAERGAEGITVTSQSGVYDLSGIADLSDAVIHLSPSAIYYPNHYLMPDEEETMGPVSVERYDELRADYLSQHFSLILPDNGDSYAMAFTLSGRHAMRVYVNGRLTAQTGHPGTTKRDTEVWENNITFYAAASDGTMDIILHNAQFHHAKRGASLASLTLSRADVNPDPFAFDRIKGLLVMGALMSAAVLLLGVYLLLSHTKATLYFALACLAMTLRECQQSQAWTYFPIPGNLSFMLEYLSLVLLTISLSLYLGQYVKNRFLRVLQYTALVGSVIYGASLLLCDSVFYTSILICYQALLVFCIVPGVIGLFWTMRRPIMEQIVILYGIVVFYVAAIFDILMYNDVFGHLFQEPISEIAMLVFVAAQTISLFMMNNRMLAQSKEAEQCLAAEKEALEGLNRMKTEFLGNVSHELKTPLTVMSGYAQTAKLLIERPDAPGGDIARRMTLISSEAERLSLMVGQILDVTRMEEGRMAMEPVRCHVDEIIHAAITTYYPILNKNANRLDIHIESGLPAVYADPVRISQVVVNLISNAVRFTTNGVITIIAKKEDPNILICVSDTGIGIAAERMPNIFERYSKNQKSDGGKNTGTGLGLYICKYIVEQHGGGIRLESKEGKGTTVCFTLPVAPSG